MDIFKHNKARICVIIIFAPWLLISFLLVWMEVQKLYLDQTVFMNKEQRRVYYLKVAMPGLEDDYFDLLTKASKHFDGRRLPYAIHVGSQVSPFVALMVRNYTIFWLSPSRPTKEEDKTFFKVFYRKRPSTSAGEIVDVISGANPSYIVKVNPQ